MGTPVLPSTNDVITFCNQIANTPETEIGESVVKIGQKARNGRSPFLWLMHRVVQEYVGCGHLVYDSWIPGVSPKFLEPAGYDVLIILTASDWPCSG